MYAISSLGPADVLRFEGLVPFDIRPVIYDLAALPRVLVIGATLMGRPVGIGIAVRGWAMNGELTNVAPPASSARILGVTVARSYRRIGIGKAIVTALEEELLAHGIRDITTNFAMPSADGLLAIDALLRSAKWNTRELTMLQCRADHALLSAPIMRDQAVLPPEYAIVDWVDLDDQDRDSIRESQRQSPWFPETLDPFHYEPELEVLNSLALRYNGDIVGWLITRRTSDTTMYYRCLFVREDLAKLGRGFALIHEAISRHAELVQSGPGYGEWSTPASLRPMCAFIRRRLEPYGAVVTEQFVARKMIGDATEAAQDADARTFKAPIARSPFLSASECDELVSRVHSARDRWTERAESISLFSLGALAFHDTMYGVDSYLHTAARTNAFLSATFGSWYDRLRDALTTQLGAPVELHPQWAHPGFRILPATRGAHLPVAPVHCDVEYRVLDPGALHARRPVSFSVLLSNDDSGAGITEWQLSADETIGLDTEETSRLLDVVPARMHAFTRGELLVHSADVYHQSTPRSNRHSGDARISLEGHALFVDGRWLAYM